MKNYQKVAPFLIVFFLGIILSPRVQAMINCNDSIQTEDEPDKKQKFTGFIIDSYAAERLLYTQQNIFAKEVYSQPNHSSFINDPDNDSKISTSTFARLCCKPALKSSSSSNRNNDASKNNQQENKP